MIGEPVPFRLPFTPVDLLVAVSAYGLKTDLDLFSLKGVRSAGKICGSIPANLFC